MDRQKLKAELERLHSESFGWALRCCFEEATAAAEVLQEVYLKVLEGKARYTKQSAFKTWLFSVIRFTAIDYYKAEKRRETASLEKVKTAQINGSNEIQSSLEAIQKKEILRKALSQLSPQQSQILHLVFYHNLSIRAASEVMNIQLGTARTHYERGKRELKKCLTNEGFLEDVR